MRITALLVCVSSALIKQLSGASGLIMVHVVGRGVSRDARIYKRHLSYVHTETTAAIMACRVSLATALLLAGPTHSTLRRRGARRRTSRSRPRKVQAVRRWRCSAAAGRRATAAVSARPDPG